MSNIIQAFPKGSGGSSVPIGGTEGQVLKKLSNTDGDAGWADDSAEELTAEEIEEIKAAFNPSIEPIDISKITVEGQTIQMDEMPLASAGVVGKVYQYIGDTSVDYKHGYFYECVEDNGSYSWIQTDAQPTFTAGEGIDIDEDNEISVEELSTTDVQDIKDAFEATNFSPLATVYHKFSTDEQVIGEWIDGKKIYQKTINCGALSGASKNVAHGISNIDIVLRAEGMYGNTSNGWGGNGNYYGNSSTDRSTNFVAFGGDKTYIRIYNGTAGNWITWCYVTLQYTKTT